MKKAFTEVYIRSITPPETGRTEISDLTCVGLTFQVTRKSDRSKKNVRSWSFRFVDPVSGKDCLATIGTYPDISLALARSRANEMRRLVASGHNPIEQKRQNRKDAYTKTFEALAQRYLAEHAWRHKRSADADDRNLRLDILPEWKARRDDTIERTDIIELAEKLIQDGKPVLANRVQALVSSIYSFALDAGLVKANPALRLRKRGAENVGRRVLSDQEIKLFWSRIIFAPTPLPNARVYKRASRCLAPK